MSESRWCSVREAAKHFSLPASTLYSLIGRGLVPSKAILKFGRAIRLDVEVIEGTAGAGLKGRKP